MDKDKKILTVIDISPRIVWFNEHFVGIKYCEGVDYMGA